MSFGLKEIAIIAILAILLFGRGRISALMGDLAKGIKSIKDIGAECVKIVKEIITSCKRFCNDAQELATAIPEIC